ncbi:Polyisoprenoid-binding protein YceI [Roseovarius azorensis]|uniref:Polyisoprenoid-binding protein YceI n=2 Tax=Roseovarius azorensis TaxID=1287727 RepID=A0A1H7XLI2_9RHOB|nr:Polyisoprenoid-binding protein YceI [Roseovarius azorensis]
MFRCVALVLCLIATPPAAAPEAYRLDAESSTVGFTYDFGQGGNRGTMPVKSADIRLDLRDVGASQVDVTLDATGARAGFFFATQAMKGPEVLDTARFPEITFRSTAISGTLQAATVSGDLTVRGVTRPVTLQAGLYRLRGRDPASRDRLTVLLTGQIDRRDFGADGFANYVGDMIGLRIIAHIEK